MTDLQGTWPPRSSSTPLTALDTSKGLSWQEILQHKLSLKSKFRPCASIEGTEPLKLTLTMPFHLIQAKPGRGRQHSQPEFIATEASLEMRQKLWHHCPPSAKPILSESKFNQALASFEELKLTQHLHFLTLRGKAKFINGSMVQQKKHEFLLLNKSPTSSESCFLLVKQRPEKPSYNKKISYVPPPPHKFSQIRWPWKKGALGVFSLEVGHGANSRDPIPLVWL